MPDSLANDELLTRLAAARPSIPADEFRPDEDRAVALLDRILTAGAIVSDSTEVPLGYNEVVPTGLAPVLIATPTRRSHRRSVAVAIVAAVIVLATVGVISGLKHGTGGSTAQRGSSSWVLTGLISQPSWTIQPSVGSDPFRVACPSTTTCYAVGLSAPPAAATNAAPTQGVVEVTHDGGATWNESVLPSAITSGSITCPAVDTCMLAGPSFTGRSSSDVLLTTTDGGQTWSSLPIPGLSYGSSRLSCATALDCDSLKSVPGPGGLGLQYVSRVTTDGGQTWVTAPMPGTFRAYALQCMAPDYCIAGGSEPTSYRISNPLTERGPAAFLYSSDGGVTWNAGTVPATLTEGNSIGSISCSDPSHCMAISNPIGSAPGHVLVTADGGRVWSFAPGELPSLNLSTISCPTENDCWVSGSTLPMVGDGSANLRGIIYSTDDAGQSWTSEQVPTLQGAPLGFIGGLACASVSSCLALGSASSTSPVLDQQEVITYSAGKS